MKSHEAIYDDLITQLERIYQSCEVNGKKCFLRSDGGLFAVDYIGSFGAFVIEYADNMIDAGLNRYEDGDLFYVADQDEKVLFQGIIQEIEGNLKPPF